MPFDNLSDISLLDRAVDEAYLHDGKAGAVARAARKYGLPVKQLYRRGRHRLLAKTNSRSRWSAAEDELLEQHPHLTGAQTVQLLKARGFPGRSREAVWLRRRTIGATYDQRIDTYTADDLAAIMGVSQNTVARWCRSGLLKARRRSRENHALHEHWREHWLIQRADVRSFLIDHPMRWKLAGVDQLWLIDILARR